MNYLFKILIGVLIMALPSCKDDDDSILDGDPSLALINKVKVQFYKANKTPSTLGWDANNGKADLYLDMYNWESEIAPDASAMTDYLFTPASPLIVDLDDYDSYDGITIWARDNDGSSSETIFYVTLYFNSDNRYGAPDSIVLEDLGDGIVTLYMDYAY